MSIEHKLGRLAGLSTVSRWSIELWVNAEWKYALKPLAMLRSSLKEFESSDMAAGIDLDFLGLEINLVFILQAKAHRLALKMLWAVVIYI